MIYHKIYHFGDFFMPKSNVKPKKPLHTANTNPKSGRENPARILVSSTLFGIAVFFVCTIIAAFLLEKSPDPSFLVPAGAMICTVISSAATGFLAVKLSHKALPYSVLSGLLMILFYLTASVFFDSGEFETTIGTKSVTVLLLPSVSLLSACLFNGRKSAKKHR